MDLERQMISVRQMIEREPDLNLYELAYDNPDLEEAALAIAKECPRCNGTRRIRNLATLSPSDDEWCPTCL